MNQTHEVGGGRVLGVDLGRRRVGLAVSDSHRRVASAFSVMDRATSHDEDHAHLASVVAETGATLVVVGLPLSLSGRAGPAAQEVQEEVAELRRVLPVPVEVCDERFSTVVADRSLMAVGRKAPARRDVVDKMAAAGILQTWLDRQRDTLSAVAAPPLPSQGQGRPAKPRQHWDDRPEGVSGRSTVPQAGSAVT
jgi:putative holliday junction resolvase